MTYYCDDYAYEKLKNKKDRHEKYKEHICRLLKEYEE